MAILDLVSRKTRLLIGGVDFAGQIIGAMEITPLLVEEQGLRTVEASVTLGETVGLIESLDPELNTRWVIGQVVTLEFANQAGVMTPHPGFGFRILKVPFYDEYEKTLEISLGCELLYRRNRDEAGADCTGIDPRTGRTLAQTINALLLVAGITTGLEVSANNPTATINYPQQKKAGESFVDQAGEMAMLAGGYIWADSQLRVRFDLSANPSTPTLTLTPETVEGYERVNSADQAEPYEELKLVATKTIVTPVIYPLTRKPIEKYAYIQSVVPEDIRFFFVETIPGLQYGEYIREEWDEVQGLHTLIGTIKGWWQIQKNRDEGGIPRNAYSVITKDPRWIEKSWFYPKPAGWDSCRPERNPKTLAGFIRRFERTHPNVPAYKKTIEYEYDKDQNLIRKYSVSINPPGRWEEDVKWDKDANGQWRKTTQVKAPGGDLNSTLETVNGVTNLPFVDGPPVTDYDSPPEAAPKAPAGFTVEDEQIEVTIKAPARGGGTAVRSRPVSVKSALSEAQLKAYGELMVALSWGRAYGRRIEIPLYDALLDSTYKPLQRWDYDLGTLKIALRAAEPAIVLTQDRCLVGVEASKIGDVNPDGTVTTPFALIYDAGAVYESVVGAEISFPPQPPLVVGDGGIYESVVGEPPLRWSILTQQQWYNLNQKQYVGMLQ